MSSTACRNDIMLIVLYSAVPIVLFLPIVTFNIYYITLHYHRIRICRPISQ